MPAASSDRTLAARIGAYASWAATADPSARTAHARRTFLESFEKQVDPEGKLPPKERARRAEALRKAHFARLALASAKARRRNGGSDAA
jgi:hypothetical protein